MLLFSLSLTFLRAALAALLSPRGSVTQPGLSIRELSSLKRENNVRGAITLLRKADALLRLSFSPVAGYQLNSAECVDTRLKRVVPDHYCHYYPENVKPKPKLKECSMDPCPSRFAPLPTLLLPKAPNQLQPRRLPPGSRASPLPCPTESPRWGRCLCSHGPLPWSPGVGSPVPSA